MDKYTIELTYEELETVVIALVRESDRLDEIDSPKYADVKCLEENVRNAYMDAKQARESERAWINAERDRTYGW